MDARIIRALQEAESLAQMLTINPDIGYAVMRAKLLLPMLADAKAAIAESERAK